MDTTQLCHWLLARAYAQENGVLAPLAPAFETAYLCTSGKVPPQPEMRTLFSKTRTLFWKTRTPFPGGAWLPPKMHKHAASCIYMQKAIFFWLHPACTQVAPGVQPGCNLASFLFYLQLSELRFRVQGVQAPLLICAYDAQIRRNGTN